MKIQTWTDYSNFFGFTKIAFYEEKTDGIYVYNLYTNISRKIDAGALIPEEFILKIPETIANDIFIALAEMLDKRGIKTQNDHKIQGTLDAQKYHLEDLRKILKLNE